MSSPGNTTMVEPSPTGTAFRTMWRRSLTGRLTDRASAGTKMPSVAKTVRAVKAAKNRA